MAIRFGGLGNRQQPRSGFGLGRGRGRGRGAGALKMRLIIAAVLIAVAVGGYVMNTSVNPYTGAKQHVAGISTEQEVVMGLQAAQEMVPQFGGLSSNLQGRQLVTDIGQRLFDAIPKVYGNIATTNDIPHEFSFTLLDDDNTINAFALPGGPTFITDALFDQLTPGQIAGVMGHEIGHVIHRHGLQRMAKQKLLQGVAGAATTAAGDMTAGQITGALGNFFQMSYGRKQELQSDREGVLLMVEAGYNPQSMITVMEVLKQASGGKSKTPEWASTHPDPDNRKQQLQAVIDELFPNGVPAGLED